MLKAMHSIAEISESCNLPVQKWIGKGDIAWGVYLLNDNKVLKMYQGKNDQISHLPEIDITRRLIHPGIVKTYEVLTRERCDISLNHALIMEYVPEEKIEDTLYTRLRSLVMLFSAAKFLHENGIRHNDWNQGNQYSTNNGFIIVDLNYESHERLIPADLSLDTRSLMEIYMPIISHTLRPTNWREFYNYIMKKGPKPKTVQFNIPVEPFENDLLYDLLLRLTSKNEDELMLFDQIPYHPIFTYHGLEPVYGSMEPRYVRIGDFPAKNKDHKQIWDYHMNQPGWDMTMIDDYNIFLMEAIDLYYRFLPFVVDEDLMEVSERCIIILSRLTNYQYMPSHLSVFAKNIDLDDKIVRSLNGQLRDKNFYQYASTDKDFEICWKLMFLPYDQYMKLTGERFMEVVPMDGSINYDILIQKMMMKHVSNTNYSFERLTGEEMGEFFNIDVSFRSTMSQACNRLYKYGEANPGTVILTEAVIDLIHTTSLKVSSKIQYTLESLLNMSDVEVVLFANVLRLDPNDTNIRERIIRILRMNYLIKL